MSDPGWHPDPTGRHQHRYWNGNEWTTDVSDAGVASVDTGPITSGPDPAWVVPTPAPVAAPEDSPADGDGDGSAPPALTPEPAAPVATGPADAQWDYFTEWWYVDTTKKSTLPMRVPERAGALGADGWEMVSVTSFPVIRYEGARMRTTGELAPTSYPPASYTHGAWFQAFYKRPRRTT